MIIVPNNLPAKDILKEEKLNIIEESDFKDNSNDVLKIALLNLMPLKIPTENQFIRLLAQTNANIKLDLFHIKEHISKNTSLEYLNKFYKTFDEIENTKYDGVIITGAPVELLEFETVDYWKQLQKIINWTTTNSNSTLFICWGAQAALYHFYGIQKYTLKNKMFGIFEHKVKNTLLLFEGIEKSALIPHSRHTDINRELFLNHKELEIACESDEAGVNVVIGNNGKQIYITGHFEYDVNTLKEEYFRDLKKGFEIKIPNNYFPNDDTTKEPEWKWHDDAKQLYLNWTKQLVNIKEQLTVNN